MNRLAEQAEEVMERATEASRLREVCTNEDGHMDEARMERLKKNLAEHVRAWLRGDPEQYSILNRLNFGRARG